MDKTSGKARVVAEHAAVIAHTFDAPRDLVFKMWTDAEHMAQWWGPRHFTNPVCEVDARPGGRIYIVMRAPDGADHPMSGVFREIAEPERLVFLAIAEDREGNPILEALTTVTFGNHDGKTRVTVQANAVGMVPGSAAMLEGMEEGWTQSLERLEEHLAQMAPGDSEFAFTRVFEAPRDIVFKAWTECGHLSQWWGPKGFTVLSCSMDLRPGGVFHYGLQSPDGQTVWGKWVFREVQAPERLVFVASFSDEQGGTARHPFATEWPQDMLSTFTFSEHDGRTTLVMRSVPINAMKSERNAFEAGRESMEQGWAGTLSNFDEYLKKL